MRPSQNEGNQCREKRRKGVGRRKTERREGNSKSREERFGHKSRRRPPSPSTSSSLRRGKRPFVPRRPPHVSYKTARRGEQTLQNGEMVAGMMKIPSMSIEWQNVGVDYFFSFPRTVVNGNLICFKFDAYYFAATLLSQSGK